MKANVLFQWLMIALTSRDRFVLKLCLGQRNSEATVRRGWFWFCLLGNGNSNRVIIGIAFLIGLFGI